MGNGARGKERNAKADHEQHALQAGDLLRYHSPAPLSAAIIVAMIATVFAIERPLPCCLSGPSSLASTEPVTDSVAVGVGVGDLLASGVGLVEVGEGDNLADALGEDDTDGEVEGGWVGGAAA